MKLRYLLIITFFLIVIIPMSLFWVWPYSKALDSQINDVEERHLVIAKNLSATFERYYQDVTGFFSIIDPLSKEQSQSQEFKSLLKSYDFTLIALIDNTGMIKNCLFQTDLLCPNKISDDILHLAKNTVLEKGVSVSTVTEDKSLASGPVLLLVKRHRKDILLAYLSTKYIIDIGKKVSFGEKGHAAIVDQAGNLLAHPLSSWIKDRKNIAAVSAVKKMLAGKTGVDVFYSPALKADMIAGYTHVANAGWGVMVPQPIKELEDKADEIDQTALLVMLLDLGLALLITIPISFILIRPLENLSDVIKRIKEGDSQIDLQWNISKAIPTEIRELKESFTDMMDNIEKNKKEISVLAYFDSNTGLPNRYYFYQLSNKALAEMANKNQKGALVFIDFDGFKAVNDTYGHRVGDELLANFGFRLREHLSLNDHRQGVISFYDALPDIIPARLGGDEFVILFRNIKNRAEVESKIRQIFDDVFSKYELYGQIEVRITGSAGVALFPVHGTQHEDLLRLADAAMYHAKSTGKNTIQFSSEIDSH